MTMVTGACYDLRMTHSDDRELQWLESEIRFAARLSDADRIRILRDLLRTTAAIQRTKSAEQLRREAEFRRQNDDLPVRQRLDELAERLA